MANDWFQFKQFKVMQDQCAMKVSTDACIQGAWATHMLQHDKTPEHIVDIGTGTGLLSLMLAQQTRTAAFEAIEINADAYQQAAANFEASAWSAHLSALHISLSAYKQQREDGSFPKADFIICNPPFFHNHLQAQQKARNDARHSVSLSKEELASSVKTLLADSGKCCIMYPQTEWQDWMATAATYGLWPAAVLYVQPKPGMQPNRAIGLFTLQRNSIVPEETLVIYEEPGVYTATFSELLQPFYLAL